jgi:putative SOS response-associated peptidase YedK
MRYSLHKTDKHCVVATTVAADRDEASEWLSRCIVPVESFFEWRAIKGARATQPYAVAMKDRTPFAIAGLWENWRHPHSGEWIRTFAAIITVPANDLVGQIHDRMPPIGA